MIDIYKLLRSDISMSQGSKSGLESRFSLKLRVGPSHQRSQSFAETASTEQHVELDNVRVSKEGVGVKAILYNSESCD